MGQQILFNNNSLCVHVGNWVILMITIAGNEPIFETLIDQPGVVIDYDFGKPKGHKT